MKNLAKPPLLPCERPCERPGGPRLAEDAVDRLACDVKPRESLMRLYLAFAALLALAACGVPFVPLV